MGAIGRVTAAAIERGRELRAKKAESEGPLQVGDRVLVLEGDFEGETGKVVELIEGGKTAMCEIYTPNPSGAGSLSRWGKPVAWLKKLEGDEGAPRSQIPVEGPCAIVCICGATDWEAVEGTANTAIRCKRCGYGRNVGGPASSAERERQIGEREQQHWAIDLGKLPRREPTLRDTLLSAGRAVSEAIATLARAGADCEFQSERVLARWVREAAEKLHDANEVIGRVAIVVGLPDSAQESKGLEWIVKSPWGDTEEARLLRRHGLFVQLEVPGTASPSWWSMATWEPVDQFDPAGPRQGWTLWCRKAGGK